MRTVKQAADAARALADARELAVDVEADAMHAFRARLCFVQVGTDRDIFLFDTLCPGVEATSLKALLEDPTRTKYFHAAGGDLQYLAEAGVRVAGLFDTHRAATLLGWQKVGLADLVRERLGVELKKEHQQSDFSLRPLPPSMREYISDDVRYLCEIGRQARRACAEANILEELQLDCDRMCAEAAARPEVGADYRPKIPREGLDAKQVKLAHAIVQALHRRRLAWAEAANVPMGRMLSNAALVELGTRVPSDEKALSRVPNVRSPFVRSHGAETLATLRELLEQHRAGTLPDLDAGDKGPRDPKKKKREEALKAFRAEKAAARKVTQSVVLTNPLVEALARDVPADEAALSAVPWFGEKRLRLYGKELLLLLRSI
ncbi:MAG: HRDC domain-containing protein [Deltaproteobacteria bacterium]|nr:HRDC domain-containing protein [Deltaproteobacteria bacterium]